MSSSLRLHLIKGRVMNILIIHNYYKQRGGEDAVFENESKALEKCGHKVFRYIRNNKEIDDYSIFQKINFVFSMFNNKKTINDLKTIISNNKIDIAHIHNIFPMISTSVYKILKGNNIKIIQTIHNYRFLCPNAFFYRNNKNCMLCARGNFIYGMIFKCFKRSFIFSILYSLIIMKGQKIFKNYIDGYITLTDFVKDLLIKFGYSGEKLYVKDNGFIDNNIRRKKSEGYFLFLGRISKEKGIIFLLDFFKKFREFKLVIAGTGNEIDIYKKNYNYANIVFKGFVDGDNKNNLIQRSEAVILPSLWYENYPVSIIEAFCCGIPVIGSDIGGVPFIIEEGKNGLLFEAGDNDSLKGKIKLFINNRLRERLGDNARKTFSNKMEMSNNVKILEKIYRDVLLK